MFSRMKTALLLIGFVSALFPFACLADDIYDYMETLDTHFTATRTENVVKISARPRLVERAFARFCQEQIAAKKKPSDIAKAWIPQQIEMMKEGYVFEIEFELLNQNLDSGISVPFGPKFSQVIVLENNKGEQALMYKYIGDKVSTLDFMTPTRKITCYFNTKTEQNTSLIRKGITNLKLKIGTFCEDLPELDFDWSLPLFYGNTPRPHALAARFGSKALPTLLPYKTQVYIEPKNRINKTDKTDKTDKADKTDKSTATKSAPAWPGK